MNALPIRLQSYKAYWKVILTRLLTTLWWPLRNGFVLQSKRSERNSMETSFIWQKKVVWVKWSETQHQDSFFGFY